jgi:hypothetical protein
MKRLLLPLLLVNSIVLCCDANDTLTRAQVYDYSGGDTFIYREINGSYGGVWNYNDLDTTISQYIISSIYLTGDSIDTLYINGYPYYTNLDAYAVYVLEYGPAHIPYCQGHDISVDIESSSQYNGRVLNRRVCTGGLESIYYTIEYVEGLGVVYRENSGGNTGDGWSHYETKLIYYSKGTERWGTLPVGIKEPSVTSKSRISVYPTINSGTIYLKMDYPASNTEFELVDVFGRTFYTANIQNPVTTIHLPEPSSGIYFWRIIARNQALDSGKLIMN